MRLSAAQQPPIICIAFIQCWTNGEDVGPTLYKCYTNVLCFLGEQMKWNESGFRPPLCTYRLNWARRTSWGWWNDWDDTVLHTQDSKFEPWRSEAEYATSRSRRLPTILTFTRGWGRNIICFFQTAETGKRTPNSGVKGSGANHYPRAPALWVSRTLKQIFIGPRPLFSWSWISPCW